MRLKKDGPRDISTGVDQFPATKMWFNTKEAARYCGYKTVTGLTYHIYTTKWLLPDIGDQTKISGKKPAALYFHRDTLDRFIKVRRTEIRPGPNL